jgi:hypothetical protein
MIQFEIIESLIPKLFLPRIFEIHLKKSYLKGNKKFKNAKMYEIKNGNRNIFLKNVLIPSLFSFISNEIFKKSISVMAKNFYLNQTGFLTKSGIKIIDFEKGNEKRPKWGDCLVINYTMYSILSDKLQKIDSSFDRDQPFIYTHGEGQIIKGLEEIIHTMSEGGKRRAIIPTYLGYTSNILGPLLPFRYQRKNLTEINKKNSENLNNLLLIDVELIEVKPLLRK